MSDTTEQTRSHGQGKTGRMTRQNDAVVDLRLALLALHTLELARQKLTAITQPLGKHEMQRVQAEIDSDLALVERTVAGVTGRVR